MYNVQHNTGRPAPVLSRGHKWTVDEVLLLTALAIFAGWVLYQVGKAGYEYDKTWRADRIEFQNWKAVRGAETEQVTDAEAKPSTEVEPAAADAAKVNPVVAAVPATATKPTVMPVTRPIAMTVIKPPPMPVLATKPIAAPVTKPMPVLSQNAPGWMVAVAVVASYMSTRSDSTAPLWLPNPTIIPPADRQG